MSFVQEIASPRQKPGPSFIKHTYAQIRAYEQFYALCGVYQFVLVRRNIPKYSYSSDCSYAQYLLSEQRNCSTETVLF